MTAVSVASFLQGASHPAHGDRRFLMSLTGARGGVIPKTATFTDLKVTQRGAGANMSVDVAEGSCFVTGTESTYQGVYHGENQGVANVAITAANVTNARKDLIVARIKDVEYGVAITNAFSIEPITGTAAASPVDPTVPDNCVVLARVAVAANATSITNANITDLRNGYTAVTGASVIGNQVKSVATGGVVPCLSTFRPTKGLYEGMFIWETDTKLLYIYNGSGWDLALSISVSLGAGQAAMAGTYTGQRVHMRGWQQSMIAAVDGTFASAFPSAVNGVLSAHCFYIGPFAVTANVTSATTSAISGIVFQTSTNAPVTGTILIGYMALVW